MQYTFFNENWHSWLSYYESESNAFFRESYALVLENYAFIRESFALICEKIIFFIPLKMSSMGFRTLVTWSRNRKKLKKKIKVIFLCCNLCFLKNLVIIFVWTCKNMPTILSNTTKSFAMQNKSVVAVEIKFA